GGVAPKWLPCGSPLPRLGWKKSFCNRSEPVWTDTPERAKPLSASKKDESSFEGGGPAGTVPPPKPPPPNPPPIDEDAASLSLDAVGLSGNGGTGAEAAGLFPDDQMVAAPACSGAKTAPSGDTT